MSDGAQAFADLLNRGEACRHAGLDPRLADRLVGETREELAADAAAIGEGMAATAPKPRAVPADAIAGHHTPQPGPPADGATTFAALVLASPFGGELISDYDARAVGVEPAGRLPGSLRDIQDETIARVRAAGRREL